MEDKKVINTIEKKLGVSVEKVCDVTHDGKEVIADVKVGDDHYLKVVLKEMRNQYGTYYRVISEEKYTEKITEVHNPGSIEPIKLKTKTEKLCGAKRKDIISFAEKTISSLADGTATLKEIEGPAKEDTTIRFVLLLNSDGSRFKQDIDVSIIKEGVTV